MNTPTLGEARFASSKSHTASDEVRIPERIEVGTDAGLQFEREASRDRFCRSRCPPRAGEVFSAFLAARLLERSLAFSRLPANRVLFEIGVHSAAYRRIEVGGAEAFE
jgi:hypothetical protein